jgi:hypothetical protein
MLRTRARMEVLQPGLKLRSGTFDDGRSWSVREVNAIDEDRNKVTVRVADGVEIAPGHFDVVFDHTVTGAAKHTVVAASPAK